MALNAGPPKHACWGHRDGLGNCVVSTAQHLEEHWRSAAAQLASGDQMSIGKPVKILEKGNNWIRSVFLENVPRDRPSVEAKSSTEAVGQLLPKSG